MNKLMPTSIRLTPEIKAALEKLAAEDNRSLSNYIETKLAEVVKQAGKRK